MTNLIEAAPRCNSPALTPGGRIIYRRTGWGVSLCNLLAALAGIGGEG